MTTRYELYTYYRSSCSARIRIAAYLKGIVLEYRFIHLLKNEQGSTEYTQLNPSATVPTLRVVLKDGSDILIRQSIAILEFLEESQPESFPLLPPVPDAFDRARVRELVNIVACDIQPATNSRMLNQAEALGVSKPQWAHKFMTPGLAAYEKLASSYGGKFSVGDEVTMADVCLSPAVDGALRFGVDITQFPFIERVYTSLQKIDAFKRGSWRAQPDTPEELRSKS